VVTSVDSTAVAVAGVECYMPELSQLLVRSWVAAAAELWVVELEDSSWAFFQWTLRTGEPEVDWFCSPAW